MYGLKLEPAADAMVEAGGLTRAHADAVLAALNATSAARQFYATAAFHVVAGQVPG